MDHTLNKKGVFGLSMNQLIAIIVGVTVFFLVIYIFWGLSERGHDIICAGVRAIAPDWGWWNWANPAQWVMSSLGC